MTTDLVHDRLGQLFAEEAANAVAAAAATAAAATDSLTGGLLQTPSVAPSLTYSESGDDEHDDYDESHGTSSSAASDDYAEMTNPRRRRASTHLIARNATDIRRITGESSTQLINRCCGGGCCFKLTGQTDGMQFVRIGLPDNDAFRSLQLKVSEDIPATVTNVSEMPEQTAFLLPVPTPSAPSTTGSQSTVEPASIPAPATTATESSSSSSSSSEATPLPTNAEKPEAKSANDSIAPPIAISAEGPATIAPAPWTTVATTTPTPPPPNDTKTEADTVTVAGPVDSRPPPIAHTDSGIAIEDADVKPVELEAVKETVETEEQETTEETETTETTDKKEVAPVVKTDGEQKEKAPETGDEEIIKGLHSVVLKKEIEEMPQLDTSIQPPYFVQPHPPYHVYPARIHNARELTRPGAEKRTYHFDLDVTDYPPGEMMDFRVGGAIGVMAPNDSRVVEDLLDVLTVPRYLRSKPVLLRTTKGRWPTVWGDEQARELITTRRDLMTWCSDVQSHPPTKQLLRILAEYAADEDEKKLLLYLCSAEGQGAFCDFRTGPHVSLHQILHAFPSAKPPLDVLLSVLQPLMPRFYSLSNDPHDAHEQHQGKTRRVVEIAVTVHETSDWRLGVRTGIGSGFFERQALRFLEARKRGEEPELYVPMFKGLMANPLAKQFVPDGPMLLIGAGVGIAPFRGFVQRRLKTANCANKVWVLQGIRDSLVDELYSGEWGVHEDEVKRVVESRRGRGRYVQEEVRAQADLVWFVINSVDGRVFVCGSTHGMGEGVHEALIDVAMQKGNLGRDEAEKFWNLKKEAGQYTAETW